MPEGETVPRIARVLAREVTGRSVSRLVVRDQGVVDELAGVTIEGVEPVGKHVLIHLSGGWSLRIHLGMHGKWRRQHVRQRRPGRVTWVCGRRGEPCLECGTAIERFLQGDMARSTYSCPSCQTREADAGVR